MPWLLVVAIGTAWILRVKTRRSQGRVASAMIGQPAPPRSPGIASRELAAPTTTHATDPHVVDSPLRPVVASLDVAGCPGVTDPIRVIRAGIGNSMDFHGDHVVVSECDPLGNPPTCDFNDLAPGQYQIVHGPFAARIWLNAEHRSTARTRLAISLSCSTSCAATVTVNADNACGATGTLEVWGDAPQRGKPMAIAEWSNGLPVKLNGLTCTNTIATVRSDKCNDDFALLNPNGDIWIEQTLHLHQIPMVALHVVDARSGTPIAGARVLGRGPWFHRLTTSDEGWVQVRTDDPGGFRIQADGYMDRLVFLPEGAIGEESVSLLPGRRIQVHCRIGDADCPSTTHVEARVTWTDDYDGAPHPCEWIEIGTWACTVTDDTQVRADLDGVESIVGVPPGSSVVDVHLPQESVAVCLDFPPREGGCVAYIGTERDGLPHTKVVDGVRPRVPLPLDAEAGEGAPVLLICRSAFAAGRGEVVPGQPPSCGHIDFEDLGQACVSSPDGSVQCRLTDAERPQGPSYDISDCADVHASTYYVTCNGDPESLVHIAPGEEVILR